MDDVKPLHGLLVDDHAMFLSGLKRILADALPFKSLTTATTPTAAAQTLAGSSGDIDLIVVDFFIPGFAATDFIAQFRAAAPHAKIICLSGTQSPKDKQAALELGANAFVGKHAPPEDLIAVVTRTLTGAAEDDSSEAFVDPNGLKALGLSPRQAEIVVLAIRGASTKEVARKLEISPETVKTHLATVYRISGVSTRVELSSWARRHGLVFDEPHANPTS